MQDIIIVEGVHDEIKIKSVYPTAECIITNGSEISKETIKLIKTRRTRDFLLVFFCII